MAREIKFRVWFGKEKRMMCNVDLILSDMPIGTLLVDYGEEYPTNVLQYTGLTDKNGKEIYEGDVVQIPCDRKCIIKYADHISAFVLVEIGGNKISNNLLLKIDYASYEVIGNIHENPELI